jgi:transposase
VDRVLSHAGMPKAVRARGASIIDPYLPFIIETLDKYPKLTAARLYAMVQQRGYPGGPSHFRSHVAQLRPRKPSEAYLRLRTLPGEQAQIDWGLCRARHSHSHFKETVRKRATHHPVYRRWEIPHGVLS